MGFIKDNTNTFEVYLTDLGKQKFFSGGLKDAITYFSMIDSDSNYEIFNPTQNEILDYYSGTTYNSGNIVKVGDINYRANQVVIGVSPDPVNPDPYWDIVNVFDSTIITAQSIPVLNHNGIKNTSLDESGNGVLSSNVFVQIPLRGKKVDNIKYRRALFGVKNNTQKEYIMYEPALDTNKMSLITYIYI